MRKLVCFTHLTFILCLLSSPWALGQERQLELINPDGSLAADSVAMPVIAQRVYLDEQLQLLATDASVEHPNQAPGEIGPRSIPQHSNELGVIKIAVQARALVAQNEQGFVFVPSNGLAGKAKLRSWAKLKIDATSFPENLGSKYQLHILWRNNFAGALPSNVPNFVRSIENQFDVTRNGDPFGSSSLMSLDWRFRDYVTRSQVVDIVDQTIAVPPGEVTIALNKLGSESSASSSMPMVTLGIVRTLSNQTAEFTLPKFGSAQGQLLVPEASFPNWGQTIIDQATLINARRVHANDSPPLPNPAQLLFGLSRSQDSISDPFAAGVAHPNRVADAVAGYYASAEGTAARALIAGNAMVPTDENGQFTFDILPIGQYELRIMIPTGTKNSSVEYGTNEPLTALGSDTPAALKFAIDADELTDLGDVTKRVIHGEVNVTGPSDRDVDKPTVNSPPVVPPTSDAFATTAIARLEKALNSPVEDISFIATPLAQVIDSLSREMKVPILLNLPKLEILGLARDTPISLNLPAVTLRSALNHVLAQLPNWDLAIVIRDEVLLITTGKDAAENPSTGYSETKTIRSSSATATPPTTLDGAAEIIESWLKSAPKNADRSELKQLLETHLSAEFDGQQQTRRAEIDRLQQLLEQSRNWLDQRHQQREQIIRQHVQELLDKQPATSIPPK